MHIGCVLNGRCWSVHIGCGWQRALGPGRRTVESFLTRYAPCGLCPREFRKREARPRPRRARALEKVECRAVCWARVQRGVARGRRKARGRAVPKGEEREGEKGVRGAPGGPEYRLSTREMGKHWEVKIRGSQRFIRGTSWCFIAHLAGKPSRRNWWRTGSSGRSDLTSADPSAHRHQAPTGRFFT